MVERLRALPLYTLLLMPAGLVVYFSFHAGGNFPRQVAIAALVVAQILTLFVLLTINPFARLSWPAVAASSGMALFAGWILLSQLWSDSPGRSILEFDRALMYLLALVLFALVGGRAEHLRVAVRAVAAVIAFVGVCALITRVAPDVWPTEPNLQNNRLSWPLTYWNALGIAMSFGTILCFHLACSRSEPRVVRVLGSAAVPALATTLLFTFSRGPMYAGAVGLLAYVLAGRPRALLTGALATLPAAAIAVKTAYDADLLATTTPTTAAATEQGHHVGRVVIACVLAAAAARALLLLIDARRRRTLPQLAPAAARRIATGAAIAGAIVAVALLAGSGAVSDAYHRVTQDHPAFHGDFRARLTTLGSPGRVEQYRAALDDWRADRVHGTGAGTYDLGWQQHRPRVFRVVDAHSLYLETLSEMGVVGLVLVLAVVVTLLGTALWRARGPDRAVYGAVFAAGLAWALHAGIDWDWEMPATTLPFIALGALALGTPRGRLGALPPSGDTRLAVGCCCVACVVVPILVLGSQSRLRDGLFDLQHGNCRAAMSEAEDSLSWLAVPTEPYQVMAYCNASRGYPAQALQAARKAKGYDPHNWETDAWLALAQAAAGRDPRSAIARAVARNPRLSDLRRIQRELAGTTPRAWRRAAPAARRQLAHSGQVAIFNPN